MIKVKGADRHRKDAHLVSRNLFGLIMRLNIYHDDGYIYSVDTDGSAHFLHVVPVNS